MVSLLRIGVSDRTFAENFIKAFARDPRLYPRLCVGERLTDERLGCFSGLVTASGTAHRTGERAQGYRPQLVGNVWIRAVETPTVISGTFDLLGREGDELARAQFPLTVPVDYSIVAVFLELFVSVAPSGKPAPAFVAKQTPCERIL